MDEFYAVASIDIDELRVDPVGMIDRLKGPVALLSHTEPIAYLVPAREWEAVIERLEDIELADMITTRLGEKAVRVQLADL
jgi:antitoxin StbD